MAALPLNAFPTHHLFAGKKFQNKVDHRSLAHALSELLRKTDLASHFKDQVHDCDSEEDASIGDSSGALTSADV